MSDIWPEKNQFATNTALNKAIYKNKLANAQLIFTINAAATGLKPLLIENTRKQATKSHKHAWKNGLRDEDKNEWISLFKHNEEKKGIELDF